MKYLVPLAASDDLFPRQEFHFPKPLVEIDGAPMIAHVISNLRAGQPDASFVFIARAQDCREFSLDRTLDLATDGRCKIVQLEHQTKGAACSALMAIDHIGEESIVVANGDQVVDTDLGYIWRYFEHKKCDAGVVTFESVHPRWSYVRADEDGSVAESAEKRVISRRAVAGLYYFRRGDAFVRAAQAAIRNGREVNGVYYISPALNEIVLEGGKVGYFDIAPRRYHSFYSPQRVEQYERDLQSQRIVNRSHDFGERAQGVTVVIPMAGLGSRFTDAGYKKPKPFIDVKGKTMIERVMDNLASQDARFVLIARKEHVEAEPDVIDDLKARGVEFVTIDKTTEGAACTVLHAREALNLDGPLLIANCDQIVDFDCRDYIRDCRARGLDGSILTFRDAARDPKWSFARLGADGLVAEVREKEAISDIATVGLYYFERASDFVNGAIDMIVRNERVNNEFYVCPVYNYVIKSGKRIGIYDVAPDAMHGIGTPDDLTQYLRLLP